MTKLRILSGSEIVRIFSTFGFQIASQKGSHVKLQRIRPDGTKQTLTIPFHDELDKGTIRAIYRQRQALRYIPENEMKEHFYTSEN
jgi:predicted RNA binding protein YcfA (HicA-like mRNA interferase family)